MKVCKRIEGEDVGDTSRAGTLFGPTLLRAASRRGDTLGRIGIARFSSSGWSDFVHLSYQPLRVPLPELSRQFHSQLRYYSRRYT
jgi:hypothetical protein